MFQGCFWHYARAHVCEGAERFLLIATELLEIRRKEAHARLDVLARIERIGDVQHFDRVAVELKDSKVRGLAQGALT